MSNSSLVALGDIFEIARGGSPRPIDQYITDDVNGVNWIMIGDASTGTKYITGTRKRIKKEGVARSRLVNPGDFLLTNSMSFGHPYILKTTGCIHDGWLVLSPKNDGIDPDYFYHLLGSEKLHLEFSRQASGTTVKNLNIDIVRRVRVSLPPLKEQRRIATILDKADAIRRKRRQAMKSLEDLTQSMFVNLVGEGHSDHASWTEYTIECLATKEKGSLRTGPFGSALRHSEFVDSAVAVLGIDNAVNNFFRWDERRYITPQKYEEMRRYTVKPNDVIITIMGTTWRSAVVPNDIPLAISTKHLATITCNRDLVEPEFLSNAFHRDAFVLGQLRGANRGAIMDGLNLGIIKSTKLKVPPLSQQQKFKRVLEKIRRIQSLFEISESSICELVNSLTARSFSGARD